jgi:hypothetical protein
MMIEVVVSNSVGLFGLPTNTTLGCGNGFPWNTAHFPKQQRQRKKVL